MTPDPPRDPRELGLFRFFARQHVFTNLVVLFVLVVGGWLAVTITKEAFPQIDFDIVLIQTPFRGAVPEEVERLVTVPIERAIKGIDGIEDMDSWSVEGFSVIVLRLDPDHPDKKKTVKDVEREVDRVRNSELPEDGDEPFVDELSSIHPVLSVDLSSAPERELRLIARLLEDDILEIPGVNKVTKGGYRREQIWVEADQSELGKLHLSLLDLINAVARSNHTSPGGRMVIDGKEVLVRTMGRLQTAKDVRDVVVRSNVEGQNVHLRDVARVFDGFEREETFTRVNGTKALHLTIFKKPSGDALDIAKEVRKTVDRYRKLHPRASFTYSDDISFYIKRRLDVLVRNGSQGIVLVLLCLFFFLSPGSAIFTTIAIPFAFLGGLIVIHLMGYTVNLLTMFAFILVSGMLVDDGVVVSEFYEKKREEGLPPFQASVVGTSQMALPITTAVLTTIVAFMPLAYVSGIMGKFLRQFPVVVVATLIVDLLECLFILPSHLALFSARLRFPERVERLRSWGPRMFKAVERLYTPWLSRFVRHPILGTSFFMVLLIVSLGLSIVLLRFHMFPVAVDEFFVSIEMPIGTSLQKTSETSAEIERILQGLPAHEVESIISEMGIMGDEHQRQRGTHYAQSRIILDRTGARTRDGREILGEIRPRLEATAERLGVVNLEIQQRRAGPPSGKPVEVRLAGDDFEVLSGLSHKARGWLTEQDGVFGVKDDFTPGKEELLLEVDVDAVARAGLEPRLVARVVRSAFDGEIATEIQRVDADEDIEVLVKLPESARGSRDTLERIRVTNPRGRLVPLSQLIRSRKGSGYLMIPHAEGKRTITVTADVDQDVTTSRRATADLDSFLRGLMADYPSVRYEFVGEEKDRIESIASLRRAMAIACIVIYTLMATLLRSFTLPLIVMSIIPFAFIGVFLTLLLHGLPLSMLVLIGLAGLMGVVVNNSILLVEAVGRLAVERPDLDLPGRLVEAGRQRLRPILLTSITTFFGVAPLGYGIGGREPFLEHVALTFGWGLLFTAFVTLFLVPTLYALLHRFLPSALARDLPAGAGNGAVGEARQP
ncbi:MAG: efflux RND transporter permease subunit [Elusimicrobiota bacterium]